MIVLFVLARHLFGSKINTCGTNYSAFLLLSEQQFNHSSNAILTNKNGILMRMLPVVVTERETSLWTMFDSVVDELIGWNDWIADEETQIHSLNC